MGNITTDNYKKSVEGILDDWKSQTAAPARRLGEIEAELGKLQLLKMRPSDDDKKAQARLRQEADDLKAKVEAATRQCEMLMTTLKPLDKTKADPDELSKIPDWLKKVVKNKEVKIGKRLTIKPDFFEFDTKALKLKSGGFKIEWAF